MTPERLQQIRQEIYWSKCASRAAGHPPQPVTTAAEELLNHIEQLQKDTK